MKALKKLTLGLIALAFSGLASAQTVIHITGSTAFRGATHTAIGDILSPGYTVGYSGTTLNSASQAIFTGTTKTGGISVVIKTSWSGSVGGVQTLSQLNPVLTVATWLVNTTAAGPNAPAVYDSATAADVTMSDSFQSSSQFYGTGYATLVDNIVGVVPFVWCKGQTSDSTVSPSQANITNMTPLLARALLSAGTMPLSMITGNSSDSAIDVVATGRDEDSGTRLGAFAESDFGIFNAPVQFQPTIAGGVITAVAYWPVNTVDGLTYPIGQSGFSSGGTLATNMNTPVGSGVTDLNGNKFVLLAYLGLSDAANVNGGANELMWNGVAYSPANVEQGRYTFWSYEHLMYRNTLGTVSPQGLTVAQQIAQQILTADATVSGVLVGSMNVSRAVEGGIVTHN